MTINQFRALADCRTASGRTYKKGEEVTPADGERLARVGLASTDPVAEAAEVEGDEAADEAAHLEGLRQLAESLGIKNASRKGAATLTEEIAAAKADGAPAQDQATTINTEEADNG